MHQQKEERTYQLNARFTEEERQKLKAYAWYHRLNVTEVISRYIQTMPSYDYYLKVSEIPKLGDLAKRVSSMEHTIND